MKIFVATLFYLMLSDQLFLNVPMVQVQEARTSHDDEAVKKSINDYEEALARYIPVLMAQAKIYWDMDQYAQVEKIFRKSVEFCSESDIWKLNVAHVLFMQVSNQIKICHIGSPKWIKIVNF